MEDGTKGMMASPSFFLGRGLLMRKLRGSIEGGNRFVGAGMVGKAL